MAHLLHTDRRGSPHVSVVMVNYNTRELTLEAVTSVFGSLRDPSFSIEVIVVDNGSSDGSAEAIEERFPSVVVVRSSENLGFGRGNNLGATHATGDALFLLNTDTIVRHGAIEKLYAALLERDDRGIAGPFLENRDGSYQTSMTSFPTVWRTFCYYSWLDRIFPRTRIFADGMMTHADPLEARDVDVINGAAMMIRRSVYESISGFDPEYFMYYEESDLCKRVAERGYRAHYTPTARVLHLINQSSRSRMWWFHQMLRTSRKVYARKHMNIAERIALATIVHTGLAIRIIIYPVFGLVKPRFRVLGRDMLRSYFPVTPLTSRKNANA